jgi:protein TonB
MLLNGDLSVSCTERPPPAYPKLSVRLGEQGKTIVLVELDELGHVINVAIKKKSGFARLDEAAIAAVKTWRCNPAKRNGAAVRAVALQPFNFILKGP